MHVVRSFLLVYSTVPLVSNVQPTVCSVVLTSRAKSKRCSYNMEKDVSHLQKFRDVPAYINVRS